MPVWTRTQTKHSCTAHGCRYSHNFLELIIKVSWPTAPISIDSLPGEDTDENAQELSDRTRHRDAREWRRTEGMNPTRMKFSRKLLLCRQFCFLLSFYFAFVRFRIFSFQHKGADSVENMIRYCVLCVRSRCWVPCAIAVRVCVQCLHTFSSMCALFSQGSSAFCCNVKYSLFYLFRFVFVSTRFVSIPKTTKTLCCILIFNFCFLCRSETFLCSDKNQCFYVSYVRLRTDAAWMQQILWHQNCAQSITSFVVSFSLKLRKSCLCKMVHPCTQRVGW